MRKNLSIFIQRFMTFFLIFGLLIIYIPINNAYADAQIHTPKKMYNLMIFVRFDGEDEFIGNKQSKYGLTRREMVENTYNKSDFSMKEYYKAVSNQKMELETIFLFADADNFSSFKLDHTRGYYSQLSDSNKEGYQGNPLTNGRWREWCRDWGDKIQATLNNGVLPCKWDGSKAIDSLDDLDSDGDGNIDCITVIYSKDSATTNLGGGSDQASQQVLWAYQGNNKDISVNTGNKVLKSDRFEQTTIEFDPANFCYKDKNDVVFLSPTPSIHETGHVLGFNDLYSYYNSNDKPVYYGSVMAKQVSPIAQFMTAREREVMGWLDKSNIGTVNGNGDFSLKPVSSNYESGLLTYKLKVPGTSNLYLYMEYRCTLDASINKFHASPAIISTYGSANGDGDANGRILRMKKNGLLVTLARYDDENHFPNNGNGAINGIWDLEVLGGTMGTKSDAPLAQNESITYKGVTVTVKSLDKEKAVFSISGMPNDVIDTGDGEIESGNNTYALTYDANGGIVLPESKQVDYGEAFGILPVPTYTGYTFDGWYTEKIAGTKVTEETTMGAADTIIYAHWTPKSYTLTFDSDGGNVVNQDKTIMYGDLFGTLPIADRADDTSIDGKTIVYKFDGWYTEKNGKGTKVTENTKMGSENIVVYANWIAETINNKYTLTYDANGGTVLTKNKVVAYEDVYGTLPIPTYTGYTFDGWYTEKAGGTKVTEETIMKSSDITIYARWTKNIEINDDITDNTEEDNNSSDDKDDVTDNTEEDNNSSDDKDDVTDNIEGNNSSSDDKDDVTDNIEEDNNSSDDKDDVADNSEGSNNSGDDTTDNQEDNNSSDSNNDITDNIEEDNNSGEDKDDVTDNIEENNNSGDDKDDTTDNQEDNNSSDSNNDITDNIEEDNNSADDKDEFTDNIEQNNNSSDDKNDAADNKEEDNNSNVIQSGDSSPIIFYGIVVLIVFISEVANYRKIFKI